MSEENDSFSTQPIENQTVPKFAPNDHHKESVRINFFNKLVRAGWDRSGWPKNSNWIDRLDDLALTLFEQMFLRFRNEKTSF